MLSLTPESAGFVESFLCADVLGPASALSITTADKKTVRTKLVLVFVGNNSGSLMVFNSMPSRARQNGREFDDRKLQMVIVGRKETVIWTERKATS